MPERPTAPDEMISREEVRHLADLARIDLSDAELDHLAPQLSVILESVASISDVADDDIEPTSHALPLTNVTRPDEVRPGLTQGDALSGAPAAEDGRFRVAAVPYEQEDGVALVLAQSLRTGRSTGLRSSPLSLLSTRERDVLALTAEGFSSAEIGDSSWPPACWK